MTLVAPQGSAVCYKANIGVASLKNAPDLIKVYRACPKKIHSGTLYYCCDRRHLLFPQFLFRNFTHLPLTPVLMAAWVTFPNPHHHF